MKLLLEIDEFNAAIEFWQTLPAKKDSEALFIHIHPLKGYAVLNNTVEQVEELKDFFLKKTEYSEVGRGWQRSLKHREQSWGNSWVDAGLSTAREHKVAHPALHSIVLNNLHHISSDQFICMMFVLLQTPETQEEYLPLMLAEINRIFITLIPFVNYFVS